MYPFISIDKVLLNQMFITKSYGITFVQTKRVYTFLSYDQPLTYGLSFKSADQIS